MAEPTRFLSLNLGMQTVTLADFRVQADGGITLQACAQEELIPDPGADVTRPAQIEAALATLRTPLGISSKREPVNFCLPSQSVFTRFVRLPGSTPDEVASIIGFEAQQNVPFPIDEVVWDYQIMGESKDNNWDVALVAIKADQLGEMNFSVTKAGFRTGMIDAAPMALYNAFRYNYAELTGCSLLIDIGARTTNLIFIEGARLFSRSIPVGGNTISAAIGKEFRQDVMVGEKLKLEKGFVGLGGAYTEPEDPTEARISKIIRNTMTRLHAEIARSISFYRQNQQGSAPVRAFLCGGTVSLPYMLEFFSEKLQMPIEFFNPLRNVSVANQETAAFVGDKAHTLGEAVGCALRALKNCPMEINLRPQIVVREQELARRKPFLLAAALCVILAPAVWWLYFNRATAITQEQLDAVNADVGKLQEVATKFDAIDKEMKAVQASAAPLLVAATERAAWIQILDELNKKLPPRFIWVTELTPLLSTGQPLAIGGERPGGAPAPSAPQRPGRDRAGSQQGGKAAAKPAGKPTIDALQISGLYLANPPNEKAQGMIDEFFDRLRDSKIFDVDDARRTTLIKERQTPDGTRWAYNFSMVVPLKHPIAAP